MSHFRHLLRRLLLALLIAAVPLQAYAAAAMLYCHERGEAEASRAGHDMHHAAGVTGGPHDHGHGHEAAGAAAAVDSGAPDVVDWFALAATGCSVCSAMCIAGALLASARSVPLPSGGHADFPPFVSQYAGVVLDLPDPPPLALPL